MSKNITINHRYLAAITAAYPDRFTATPEGLTVVEDSARGVLSTVQRDATDDDARDVSYLVASDWIREFSVTIPEAVEAAAFALGNHGLAMRGGVPHKTYRN